MACAWYEWTKRQKAAKEYLKAECEKSKQRAERLCVRIRAGMTSDCMSAQARGDCPHYNTDCADCTYRTKQGRGAGGGWCSRHSWGEDNCVKLPQDRMSGRGPCSAVPFADWVAGTHKDCPVYAKWVPMYQRAMRLYCDKGHSEGWHERVLLNMAGKEPAIEEYAPELAEPMFIAKYEKENPIERPEDYDFKQSIYFGRRCGC